MIATNVKGSSEESSVGNGAIIFSTPDKPYNLMEETTQRTKSSLGLKWTAGADNGNPITSYKISRAIENGSF